MSRFGSPLAALFAATLVFGCSSDDSDDSDDGAGGTGGGGQMSAAVTFTEDIHPIFLDKCGGGDCHNGDQAPILPAHAAEDVMEAYQATQDSASSGGFVYERILERITDETLPMPPNFANPPCEGGIGEPGCVSRAELDLIEAWIDAGTPL